MTIGVIAHYDFVFTLCSFWFELSPYLLMCCRKMRSASPAPPSAEVNVTKDDAGVLEASADFGDSDAPSEASFGGAPLNEEGIPADQNHGAYGDASEMLKSLPGGEA